MNLPRDPGTRKEHSTKGRQAKATPGGTAAGEWEAKAAICREAQWWGAKETQAMPRVQVFLLTVPAQSPKLNLSSSRYPSPGASSQLPPPT